MRLLITFSLILFLTSCGHTDTAVVNEIHVTYRDHFLNGKRSIDSLKELSVKAGLIGDFERIKELCELVCKIDSADADNLSRLSMIYMIEGKNEKGLSTINRSIHLDTGNYLTQNIVFKACMFRELQMEDSANSYFNRMLQTKNYGEDLNAVTQAFILFKNNAKGLEYNNLTLKYYPLNEDANLTEAMRIYQTDPDKGIQMLSDLEKNVKTARVYATRSVFFHNLNKYDLALKDANKAVELSHGEPWIITGRGRTKHLMKDYEGAEIDYKYSISRGDTTADRFYKGLLGDMNRM